MALRKYWVASSRVANRGSIFSRNTAVIQGVWIIRKTAQVLTQVRQRVFVVVALGIPHASFAGMLRRARNCPTRKAT